MVRMACMTGAYGAATLLAALLAAPAAAEVTTSHPLGFIVRHEMVVKADPKQVWLALISPDTWWSPEHTWSGDSANLSIMPSAGGCFCERIPEVEGGGRFTLEGSVEHMRVVQAYPERALRMRGELGPLQGETVQGILTVAISEVETGTRLVWEYNVAGYMRYEIPVISRVVDGVIGKQVAGLAALLGPVNQPARPSSGKAGDDGPGPPADPAAAKPSATRRVDKGLEDPSGE